MRPCMPSSAQGRQSRSGDFGHGHKLHSAHFFDLADQPIEVTMALSAEDADRLFQRLREEKINVFYVKTPTEFGMTNEF